MALAKGTRSIVGWKEEATYGTLPTTGWISQAFNSEAFAENIETIQGDDIRADRANPSLRGGNIAVGGQLTHDFGPVRNLMWFKHLLAGTLTTTTPTISAIANTTAYKRGDVVKNTANAVYVCLRGGTVNDASVGTNLTGTGDVSVTGAASTTLLFRYLTGTEASVRKHALAPGVTMPTGGVAMEKGIIGGSSDMYIRFAGGRIGSLELAVPQSGMVKATWNMLFTQSSKAASSIDADGYTAVLAESPFTGFDTSVHLNDTARTNQTPRPIREFSMSLTNNIQEDVYILGSRFRNDLPEGRRVASGRLSTYFMDSTEYDLFKNETTVPLTVAMINTEGHLCLITFEEVKITGDGTPKISGQGIIQAEFNWTAFKNTGTEVSIEFWNLNATNPA